MTMHSIFKTNFIISNYTSHHMAASMYVSACLQFHLSASRVVLQHHSTAASPKEGHGERCQEVTRQAQELCVQRGPQRPCNAGATRTRPALCSHIGRGLVKLCWWISRMTSWIHYNYFNDNNLNVGHTVIAYYFCLLMNSNLAIGNMFLIWSLDMVSYVGHVPGSWRWWRSDTRISLC